MANKNGLTLAITVLIVLAINGSAIDELYKTIIPEDSYTTSYNIASLFLDECVKQCKLNKSNMQSCINNCIIRECQKRHPTDEKARLECIETLKAKYNVHK